MTESRHLLAHKKPNKKREDAVHGPGVLRSVPLYCISNSRSHSEVQTHIKQVITVIRSVKALNWEKKTMVLYAAFALLTVCTLRMKRYS